MKNPTIASLREHFVADNGWTELELQDMLDRYPQHVNADGTTNISHDEWEALADQEPESN